MHVTYNLELTDYAAYFATAVSYTRNIFMKLTTGDNLIKLFFFLTGEEAKEARVFSPEKPFQPGLIFYGKKRAYLSGGHYLGRLRLY
jgi:hypothetical protein